VEAACLGGGVPLCSVAPHQRRAWSRLRFFRCLGAPAATSGDDRQEARRFDRAERDRAQCSCEVAEVAADRAPGLAARVGSRRQPAPTMTRPALLVGGGRDLLPTDGDGSAHRCRMRLLDLRRAALAVAPDHLGVRSCHRGAWARLRAWRAGPGPRRTWPDRGSARAGNTAHTVPGDGGMPAQRARAAPYVVLVPDGPGADPV
jgi:hypothetical protein